MVEPLSTTASIIAVLQLTGTVIGYIRDTRGASSDRKRILEETTGTHYLIYLLKDHLESQQCGDTNEIIKWLEAPNGPLVQFKIVLEHLARKLRPVDGMQKIGKALIWPFQYQEVKEILSTIERQKSLFNLALHQDHM